MINRSAVPLEFIETSIGAMHRVCTDFDGQALLYIIADHVDIYVGTASSNRRTFVSILHVPRAVAADEFHRLVCLAAGTHRCQCSVDVLTKQILAVIEWSTVVELIDRYAVTNGL